MHSIATKLLLSFLAVVLVGVVAVAFLANRATGAEFATYIVTGTTMREARIAEALGTYYATEGSWAGVGPTLATFARGPQERLILADDRGTVVGDSAGNTVGLPVARLGLSQAIAIAANGRQVGSLYTLLEGDSAAGAGQGPGAGMMGRGMRGMGAGNGNTGNANTTVQETSSPEQSFLSGMQTSLWWAALLAGLLALALAVVLTRQFTRPLRALSAGADRVAAGDLHYRVAVNSRDELGRLAVSFNTMAANLERNEAARRNLLADVAHELRTPLSIIEGTADAILDGVYDLSAENVRVVKDQAELLARLIADLRDLSLAEAGQFAVSREPTDLPALARRAVEHHDTTAHAKGVQLSLDAASPVPSLAADQTRISQVLNNLLANAIRYTPAGGTVTLRVAYDEAADRAVISVADSGEGIAPEDLPNVFDRFFRADRSRARRSGGSGLGLAIARQIVVAHGGEIRAESQLGSGSTFTFTLPVTAKEPAVAGNTTPRAAV